MLELIAPATTLVRQPCPAVLGLLAHASHRPVVLQLPPWAWTTAAVEERQEIRTAAC